MVKENFMGSLKKLVQGEYSIHLLFIIIWYVGTASIQFIFEKYPTAHGIYRIDTMLYLFATSRFLQALLSLIAFVGIFSTQRKQLTKVGMIYLIIIAPALSFYIVSFYDLIIYINAGDCESSPWCMMTYFTK
ncbi:hypothetical protein V8S68_000226 [Providencia stuartii]